MAQPQRGHCVAQAAQVVPQDEQVLVVPRQEQVLQLLQALQLLHVLQVLQPHTAVDAPPVVPGSLAQADCGNNGREKNSSFFLCYR